jgi:hypothetical protein
MFLAKFSRDNYFPAIASTRVLPSARRTTGLSEAIQFSQQSDKSWIATALKRLAMTGEGVGFLVALSAIPQEGARQRRIAEFSATNTKQPSPPARFWIASLSSQ